MSLLNRSSQFDLIAGTNTVGEMGSTTGPLFDLGMSSTLQPDSLAEIPTVSLFQDLDGNQGPLFDQGMNSSIHAFSVFNIPVQSGELPYVPNSANGYQSNVSPNASYNANWPNVPFTNFSLPNVSPSPFGGFSGLGSDVFTVGNTLLDIPGEDYPPPSQFQDVNTTPFSQGNAPSFDFGTNSTFQTDSLLNAYQSVVNPEAAYNDPNYPNVGPVNSVLGLSSQDLNTTFDNRGNAPLFDNGPNPPFFHEDLLVNMYTSTVNPEASYGNNTPGWPNVGPGTFDLNNEQGPAFDNGVDSTLQTDSLLNIYTSAVNSGTPQSPFNYNDANYPNVGPVGPVLGLPSQDLNTTFNTIGNAPIFDNGMDSDLHVNLLQNQYTSTVNPQSSYGAGQPGGVWPAVQPSPVGGNFADLNINVNSNTPTGYVNPDTGQSY